MTKEELLTLLWAIYLAEGAQKARVPFGYLPLEKRWKEGTASFWTVVKSVALELKKEHAKWLKAVERKEFNGDFVRWLARIGYNANPQEWNEWEKNVRAFISRIKSL